MKSILIPARGGSKRVPNKNIKMLGDHPLVAHTIILATALEIPCYVSTDSLAIAKVAADYGAQVIARPSELAQDGVGDLPVIQHAMSIMGADLIIYLRPTTPFRREYVVKEAIKLMEMPGYDSLRSVEEMSESAYKCFRIKAGILRPLSRLDLTDKPNQECPRTYHPNGYIDIVRRSVLEYGSLWGSGRYGFVTPYAIELDTLEQWDFAEWMIQRRLYE